MTRRQRRLVPTHRRQGAPTLPSREADEQRALFQWAAWSATYHPELRLLYAIPNGGHRDKRTAAILVGQGVKPGMPDVCLPVPRGPYPACYLELKTPRGRLSARQVAVGDALRAAGNVVHVAVGWEAAAEELLRYLRIRPLVPLLR